jgi:anthranilate phosphoribosyltransferase
VSGFGRLSEFSGPLTAQDADLPNCELAELKGGDVTENIQTLHALLSGDKAAVSSGLRNSVLLNAGAALWVAGQAADLKSGVELARERLDSGAVSRWLESVRKFYQSI